MKSEHLDDIINHIRVIEGPCIERNKRHTIWDIIILTICTVVCGCDTCKDIERSIPPTISFRISLFNR